MAILQRALRFAQTYYNVGCPSQHFCLLRCLDIVAPVMLIQRKRSDLEVAFKTLCHAVLLSHLVGLLYDFGRQSDIRSAMDIFSMLSLFICIYFRVACLRNYRPDIAAMERLDNGPKFRAGTPYGDAIRCEVVHKDNVYLGAAIVFHLLTVSVYMWQNLATQDSFVTLITYWPTDLSTISPTLDKLVQCGYCMTGYFWGWTHAAGQFTIIILMRMTIAEFRVFLHSLTTLDEQIEAAACVAGHSQTTREQLVRALLDEHARQHRKLIGIMLRLRALLRPYALLHFSFYMAIVAAFMTRTIVLTGTSTLGMATPIMITLIFFFETLGLCLLVEQLIQLNRKVAFTLYSFDWPACLPFGRSIKRTMMMMIMQANNTVDFSAGGLTTISAELFAKSCRVIYTMMMAMANLTNSDT